MINKLFSELDRTEADYISFWEDICNIESPTSYKEGVDRVGSYFAEWAKQRGFKVEIHKENISGDAICITMNENAKGRPIALSAHMDTVHPVGSFGTPAVKISDGTIYGPGVCDCKGGAAAAAYAMDALHTCGYTDRPVMLILQADEENSSKGSDKRTIRFMCEKAKDAEAFLNLEGYSEGKAVITRKGILNYIFKIYGVEAHGSACATEGASAICEAAHKIIEMEKLKDKDGLTCTCGVIKGGKAPNTVAGYCEFMANIRFANASELEYARQYARRIADSVSVEGCHCELVEYSHRAAMEYTERNEELLNKLNNAFTRSGLPTLTAKGSTGGSDAADVTMCGIPCLDSLGTRDHRIHSPEESAPIYSLKESAKRLVAVAVYL